MTASPLEDRDPLDAFWDMEDRVGGLGETVAYALLASTLAVIGLSLWSRARTWRASRHHIVPSAADIYVRPPPPR